VARKPKVIIGIILLAAVILLPTGIDDAFTTIPLIAWLGMDSYLKIVIGLIAAMIVFDVSFDDVIKQMKKLLG